MQSENSKLSMPRLKFPVVSQSRLRFFLLERCKAQTDSDVLRKKSVRFAALKPPYLNPRTGDFYSSSSGNKSS